MNAPSTTVATSVDVAQHLPFVRFIVSRMNLSHGPELDREDLVAYGVVGLMEAARRYEPGLGTFTAFAAPRIRGAVLDALRANDFLSRSTRRDVRRLREAEGQTGTTCNGESRVLLELSPERLESARAASNIRQVPLNTLVDPGDGTSAIQEVADDNPGALECYLEKELINELAALVRQLPERERTIIALHFVEGLTMRKIGRMMNVSETRICQLQARALSRLRSGLNIAA